MARNTAQQGATFERDVMHYLAGCQVRVTKNPCLNLQHATYIRDFGYDCMRSAASKGAIDVWAVGPLRTYSQGETPDAVQLLVQCKITNLVLPPAERLRVQNLALRAGAIPLVSYRAKDITTGRMRPHFRRLTGPRASDWLLWEPGEDN